MSKVVNWNKVMTPHGTRSVGGSRPAKTTRERLQKGLEEQRQIEQAQEVLQKAMPALQALLKSRLQNKTVLTVLRPINYVIDELVTEYDQVWDDHKYQYVPDLDKPKGSHFQPVRKSIVPGTNLILKSLDPNLQEFIFEDQSGKEIVLPYVVQNQLMMQTNVYEDVVKFLENKGE